MSVVVASESLDEWAVGPTDLATDRADLGSGGAGDVPAETLPPGPWRRR